MFLDKKYQYFNVFSIEDIFCNSTKCSSHKNRIRILRDNDGHLSIPAAKELVSPYFKDFLNEIKLL